LLERISKALNVPIKDLFDFFPHQETMESPVREEILSLVNTLCDQPRQKVKITVELVRSFLPHLK